MKFSLRLNNDLPLADYVRLAQEAERAGFDQIWVSHDLFLRSAPVILTAVAQATARLEIGAGILNPYTMHPGEIAMLAATLDELSGNRFNLGLAAGAGEFLKWVGIEQAHPLGDLRESITAIRLLLAGEAAAVQGDFLRWQPEAYLRFKAHVGADGRSGRRSAAAALSAGTLFCRQALSRRRRRSPLA
jgi:5,10-methylenetetrahydromethanopterin reductase